MNSKNLDANFSLDLASDQKFPVAHGRQDNLEPGGPELSPQATTKALSDPSGRLDALFADQGPPDLSSDEDVSVSDSSALIRTAGNHRQLLTFSLDSEEYALDIEAIREIIKPREITEIPRAPKHILGILSLRGQVIPIYDLKQRLKLGRAAVSANSRIIVCQHGELVAGLLVDGITQVVRIAKDGVEATPANIAGVDRSLLLGVGRCQGRLLILLNLPNIIDGGLN